MAKSNYAELATVNCWLGGQAITPPATVYIGLFTSDPTDDASGTEVSGGSYARVSKTNNLTNFPSANPKLNATEILFPTPTAGWGTVTHFGIFDAATAGNLIYHAALGTSKTINTGDEVKFAASALSITEN